MINFKKFLDDSYQCIETVFEILDWDNYSEFPEDWSRENFELMVLKHVETTKNEYILPYGCTSYQYSNCIKDKSKKYYRIACNLKNDNNQYFLVSFTGIKNGEPYWMSPFDYIYLEAHNRETLYKPYTEIDHFLLAPVGIEVR